MQRACGLLLVLALLAAPATHADALQAVERRLQALRAALTHTFTARTAAQHALRLTDERLSAALVRLRSVRRQIRQAGARQAALERQARAQRARLERHLETLSAEIRAAYLLERKNYWTLLLDQEHPARLSRTLRYYRYVLASEAREIQRLQQALAQLQGTEQQIGASARELKALATAQWREEHELTVARARHQEALARLDQKAAGQKARLGALEADEHRLRRLMRHLAPPAPPRTPPPAVSGGGRFSVSRGRLPLPIRVGAGGQEGVPVPGAPGVFFEAPSGTRVHAVFGGRVIYAGWLRGFGLLLILEHEGGYMTVYAHVQALYRQTGDPVLPGEVIATAGRSGGFRHSGLYFEIRRNGQPLNPLAWLRR